MKFVNTASNKESGKTKRGRGSFKYVNNRMSKRLVVGSPKWKYPNLGRSRIEVYGAVLSSNQVIGETN